MTYMETSYSAGRIIFRKKWCRATAEQCATSVVYMRSQHGSMHTTGIAGYLLAGGQEATGARNFVMMFATTLRSPGKRKHRDSATGHSIERMRVDLHIMPSLSPASAHSCETRFWTASFDDDSLDARNGL